MTYNIYPMPFEIHGPPYLDLLYGETRGKDSGGSTFNIKDRTWKSLLLGSYAKGEKHIISNWGVNSEKITVIYNAFHAPHFEGTKEEHRKKLGWGGTVIISAGRLVPWKGFDTLISLMPEIAQEVPGARLYIAGDGPDKNYLESKIKESKAQKLVTLLGRVKQEDLFGQIKASDLFVLNTSYEGLSHQLLEVMALETPIVTTKAGGNVETVDHNESGFLVGYNDREILKESILKLLKDRSLANKFVENGKKKLGFFGEERMLSEISSFLKQ